MSEDQNHHGPPVPPEPGEPTRRTDAERALEDKIGRTGPVFEHSDPDQTPSDELPSALKDRYRLVRVLGQGGFAHVYLAYDSVLDQQVAVKVLKLGLASEDARKRFLFEARVGAKLRHPNIATVFDIVQTAEGLQMIMEYYPEGTLKDRFKKKGALRRREAIDIARQVGLALAYAHRRNFIHRDVKPANIFMTGEGVVKLGDFGIAARTEMHEYTQTGMIVGTPLYMAPEQATDSRDVDPRADLYSLGLVMYHMLTGHSPRVLDLAMVDEEFRDLLRRATEPERKRRLVSAEQFVAMLDQIEHTDSSGGREEGDERPGGEGRGEGVSTRTARPVAEEMPTVVATQVNHTDEGTPTSAAAATASGRRMGRPSVLPMVFLTMLIVFVGLGFAVWLMGQGEDGDASDAPDDGARIAAVDASSPSPELTAPVPESEGKATAPGGDRDRPEPATPRPTPRETPTPTPTPPPPGTLEPDLAARLEQLLERHRTLRVHLQGLAKLDKAQMDHPINRTYVANAMRIIREQVRRMPEHPLGALLEAMALNHLGRLQEARQAMRRAIILNRRQKTGFNLNNMDAIRAGLRDGLALDGLRGGRQPRALPPTLRPPPPERPGLPGPSPGARSNN